MSIAHENLTAYFMKIATIVATRSTCLDKQVGAIIVKDRQIISTGYNGAPCNIKSCMEEGYCSKLTLNGDRPNVCLATHAEINALIQAGRAAKGGTLYTTLEPCFECAKAIINAGIKKVVFLHSNNKSIDTKHLIYNMFNQVGIDYSTIPEDIVRQVTWR